MEKMSLCLLAYTLILTSGLRALKTEGRKVEMLLFVLIVAGCMYMSFAKLFKWQPVSIITVHEYMFNGIGKWIESMLASSA